MPWQSHKQANVEQGNSVHVAAGDASGAVHVWEAIGTGQGTWQSKAVHQQVKALLPLDACIYNGRSC